MRIEFYKIYETYSHRYYKVPKDLFENSRYKTILNSDAKLLYALLLDRMELSRENGWVNENGEIYLIYTREEICNMLGLCVNTVIKAFHQLSESGLIFEKRQGRGMPNLIYIGKIVHDEAKAHSMPPSGNTVTGAEEDNISNSRTVKNQSLELENLRFKNLKKSSSRTSKNQVLELEKIKPSKTDNNKTDINETENSQSVSQADRVRDLPIGQTEFQSSLQTANSPIGSIGILSSGQIDTNNEVAEFERIVEQCQLYLYNDKNIQFMFRHVLEIMWFSEFLRIGSARIPQCMVRSRMHLLNLSILEYALRKIKVKAENIKEIRNSTMYLASTIFSSIGEMHLDPEVDPELNRYMDHSFFIDEDDNPG